MVLVASLKSWERIGNDALRTTFKLTYPALVAGSENIIETREISLDANSNFCKIIATFSGAKKDMLIAAGITLHDGSGEVQIKNEQASVEYWEKLDKNFGMGGVAVIFPKEKYIEGKIIDNHVCAISKAGQNKSIWYYFGAGWDQIGYKNAAEWGEEVKRQSIRIKEPLMLRIK